MLIVSAAPIFVVRLIALATLSFDDTATWPPLIFKSFATAASIFTPPAVALMAMASIPVPAELINKLESFAPVCSIVKSWASALAVCVIE